MQKMRKHLQDHIEYPEVMQQFGFEGAGEVEVVLSKAGAIEETRIIKSISPFFDQAIIEAFDSLNFAYLEGEKYSGKRIIQLPVVFSIE